MGDFILDFRERGLRSQEAERLRFYPDMEISCIERDAFTLFVSRAGRAELWAPYVAADGTTVAIAGNIALDADEWGAATRIGGEGGLACKAIYLAYRAHGVPGLQAFGGGFAVHVHDPAAKVYHLVTDRAGAYPCYAAEPSTGLFSSHPDALASMLGSSSDIWDRTSFAQFIATGVVSFPHSYYRDVFGIAGGSIHSFSLDGSSPPRRIAQRYAPTAPEALSNENDETIATRIAAALSAATRRRTLPVLGRTAVALSGGLDSRAILCSTERGSNLIAFCAFDELNEEFRSARAIADALGVELMPFVRPFDHYATNAEMGVRISGGMGELASNHFLGFRDRFRELGIDNLVTGCYFDYLFKSLAIDARERGLLRKERFRSFAFQSYLPHFQVDGRFTKAVRDRMEELFPEEERALSTPLSRSRIAAARIFPLYHEGDNIQRLVPLRVMQWYTPALDPVLLDLSRTMPPAMKLNAEVFRKAVRKICGDQVARIPDNNTGLPLGASRLHVALGRYQIALRRRMERASSRMATAESWPNWAYYIRNSKMVRELWQRPNPLARELLGELCGRPFNSDPCVYLDRPTQYFMRLLTLKLWFDQRVSMA